MLVHAIGGHRPRRHVGDGPGRCGNAERGDETHRPAVDEREQVGPFYGMHVADRTGREVDAAKVETQTAARARVQSSVDHLRRARLPRGVEKRPGARVRPSGRVEQLQHSAVAHHADRVDARETGGQQVGDGCGECSARRVRTVCRDVADRDDGVSGRRRRLAGARSRGHGNADGRDDDERRRQEPNPPDRRRRSGRRRRRRRGCRRNISRRGSSRLGDFYRGRRGGRRRRASTIDGVSTAFCRRRSANASTSLSGGRSSSCSTRSS